MAIRTASKPLASRFQSYVLAHPQLRPVVLKAAQGLHAMDFAISRMAEGKPIGTGKKFIAALDDERAMDLAGKFVSEGFVLAVGIGVLGWEFNRNQKKDADKRVKEEAYRQTVDNHFGEIRRLLQNQANNVDSAIAAIRARQDAVERQIQKLQEEHVQKLQRSASGWGILGVRS